MTRRRLMLLLLATLAAGPAARAETPSAKKGVLPTTITFDSSQAKSGARIALGEVADDFPRDFTATRRSSWRCGPRLRSGST